MTSRKSSFIWNYFDEVFREKAQCRLCQSIFSRKGCCTSGLITHLKMKHTEMYKAAKNGADTSPGQTNNVKKEQTVDKDEESKKPKAKKRKNTSDGSEATLLKFENYAYPGSSSDSAEWPESKREENEFLYLNNDEYPVVSIAKEQPQQSQEGGTSGPSGVRNTSNMETILTKQLQIQAKLYKEMKERLEQIEHHLRDMERNSRRTLRIKANKLRLMKEDLKRKEEYRKEKHRLKMLDLEMRSKKAPEDHLIL